MKHVRAHIKMNERVFAVLRAEAELNQLPLVTPGYEVRIDPTQPDDAVEVVDAHTIKPFRYIRPGGEFWWGDTLYVNPHDERLT